MNTERLREISDWLKAGAPERGGVVEFNMAEWSGESESGCGSICCIGGTAQAWYSKSDGRGWISSSHFLGLTEEQAEELFFASNSVGNQLHTITPAWAARCIDHLIATGVVDWEGTRSE